MEVGKDFNIKVTFSAVLGMKGTQRDPEAFLVQVQYRSDHLLPQGKESALSWFGNCGIFFTLFLKFLSYDL